MNWSPFPHPVLAVSGLPWFAENQPRLWRLSARNDASLPDGVRRLMRHPTGARIRFTADTSELRLRVRAPHVQTRCAMSPLGCRGLDVYVNGAYWASDCVTKEGVQVLTLFEGASRNRREITIYLPTCQEIELLEVGVDDGATIGPPPPFSHDLPLVLYGSSIAQGIGVSRPAMSYGSVVTRRLNLDFVNLGFGGAGKAEPVVVRRLAELDACCFLFDLGKSYGMQPEAVYADMLETVRKAHRSTPLVCITPIFSTREFYNPDYQALSRHTRDVMRAAAAKRINSGDRNLHVVEGLDLLGETDADSLHEGVHPTDLGFVQIADRLQPLLTRVIHQADRP